MGSPGPTPSISLDDTLAVFASVVEPGTPLTATEVADRLGCARRTAYRKLERLADQRALRTKKVGSRSRVWWVPPSGTGDAGGTTVGSRDRGRRVRFEETAARRMLDVVPMSLGVVYRDGGFEWTNERARERLGTDGRDLAVGDLPLYDDDGRPVSPADRPATRVFQTGEPIYDWDGQIELPRGRVWVSMTVIPLGSESPPERVLVATKDVTTLKEQARRLERQRAELGVVFDRVTDAVYALDDEWRFTYVNERAAEVLQRPVGELLGASLWEEFPICAEGPIWEEYHEAMETQEPASFEMYYDPLEVWVEITAYPSETGLSVYLRDITERLERERALEESEQRYRTLTEHLPNGTVTLFDENLRYTLVEGGAFEDLDISPEGMTGHTPREVFPGEVGDRLEPTFETALAGTEDVIELEYEGRNWIIHAVPVRDEDGDVFAGMTLAQDITGRKAYERELRRYETLIEESADVNAILDPDGTIRYVTPSVEYVLGYSLDGLVGDDAFDYIHPADREHAHDLFASLVDRSPRSMRAEFRFRRADGSWVWFEGRGRNLLGDPVIDGLVVYTRDITDRKASERQLETRARQQAVVSELGREALENPALDELFGAAARRVTETLDTEYCQVLELADEGGALQLRQGVGWRDTVVGHTTIPADDHSQAGYTLQSEAPIVVQNLGQETRFSGTDLLAAHDVTSGISTIIGSVDEPWGVLGTHATRRRAFTDEDVTFVQSVANVLAEAIERQAYEDELETLVDELAASNERLKQFAYVASHDLQEPLRMVSSYLQLLERSHGQALDTDAREYIDYAVDGADRMREMIDDLLAYARVDTQAEPPEPTDCSTVVDRVLATLKMGIEERDAEIEVDPLPTVVADENQLEQVFQNLLSNAIKYSGDEPPHVEIDAERQGNEWVFRVADDGIGMPPERSDRIFDVFHRLHSREEYSGTGIGLALCRRIVERHGGRIWVESTPGDGATFSFTIPAAAEGAIEADLAVRNPAGGR